MIDVCGCIPSKHATVRNKPEMFLTLVIDMRGTVDTPTFDVFRRSVDTAEKRATGTRDGTTRAPHGVFEEVGADVVGLEFECNAAGCAGERVEGYAWRGHWGGENGAGCDHVGEVGRGGRGFVVGESCGGLVGAGAQRKGWSHMTSFRLQCELQCIVCTVTRRNGTALTVSVIRMKSVPVPIFDSHGERICGKGWIFEALTGDRCPRVKILTQPFQWTSTEKVLLACDLVRLTRLATQLFISPFCYRKALYYFAETSHHLSRCPLL